VRSVVTAREALRRGAKQKLAEFAPLVATVGSRRPSSVIEIGSLHGGTLFAWCQTAAPTATLVSVDLPGGAFGGGYREDRSALLQGYAQPGQTLDLLRMDSHAPATLRTVRDVLDGRLIDFLMVDGDHTYDGVRRDFELYSTLMAPGGLIAFHDVLPHPGDPDCEVDRLWNELKRDFEHCELLDAGNTAWRGQWGGIGVLTWPAESR
jgi:cephalosporin hydroxylase